MPGKIAPSKTSATTSPETSGPETSGHPASDAVSVLIAGPLPRAFDYRVPVEMRQTAPESCGDGALPLPLGTIVSVPLGRREMVGVVWGAATDGVSPARLKDLTGVHDAPPIADELRSFVDWVSGYVMAPPGAVLRMAVGHPGNLALPKPQTLFTRALETGAQPTPNGGADSAGRERLTPARLRVLDVCGRHPPMTAADLAAEAGVSPGVVKAMADRGMLRAVLRTPDPGVDSPPEETPQGPTLSEDQKSAADILSKAVADGGFQPFVLDGVTGSGKTEVYFEAIVEAIRAGRQTLVLLPEIALSAQWLDRFRARFGFDPCAWHSEVTSTKRRQTWRAVATGKASVVVGARSALFLPFRDLALIIVDEEHDGAFKQEDGVIYNARDMAIVRAKLAGVPVVLASATPSLETLGNARAGRFRHLVLPDRHGQAVMPTVDPVDMRRDMPPRGRYLAPSAVTAMGAALERGEQVMLFLNRRGYAPLTLCRSCGHRLECPNCTAWLVDHRLSGRLLCHHCGHSSRPVTQCTACGAEESYVPCGPGVERIAEEVADLFPERRALVMASDLIHTASQAAEMIARIQAREIDIVIGTQLVAKGHHFPLLSLVVVVDADIGFEGGDFRAFERTFQLLSQVGGRSGRAETSGTVLLQTRAPDHPVIQALATNDRNAFLEDLLDDRQRHDLPPFSRMAAIIVSGPDATAVDAVAQALGRSAPCVGAEAGGNAASDRGAVSVVGPAPAPLALLRGRHRRRLLMTADRRAPIQAILSQWIAGVDVPSSVRVAIDIDPYSFL